MKEQQRKTYLIGTVNDKEHWAQSAMLFEIEYVEGPAITVPIGESSIDIQYRRKKNTPSGAKTFKSLKFFKLKKFLAKATDGTSHFSGKKFDELYEKELEEYAYLGRSKNTRKIHYRFKLSKSDLELIDFNKIYCHPDDITQLIFKEDNEDYALMYFKDKVETNLYIGATMDCVMTDRLSNYNFNLSELFIGKGKMLRSQKNILSDIDIDYDFYNYGVKNYYDISDNTLSSLYTISNRFVKKLLFLEKIMDKTPENYIKLNEVLKEFVPDFGGFVISNLIISADYLRTPVPFFTFENCLPGQIPPSIEGSLETFLKDWREFLINPDYFVMTLDVDDIEALGTASNCFSDDIKIQNLVDSEPRKLKEYFKKKR